MGRSDSVTLEEAGLDPATAEAVLRLLPSSPPRPLEDEGAFLLSAAVAAAADPRLLPVALPALLAALDPHREAFDKGARGRLLHLQGLRLWRLDDDRPAALHALNRAAVLLEEARDAGAPAYLGRVCDTLGQMLHAQGLLTDARVEFERALVVKGAGGDVAGAALTHGNLGRLCMELGDYAAALEHLERDLAHVEADAPEMTRLRSQLLTQIGACLTGLGDVDAARERFDASAALATAGDDAVGLAFVTVYRGLRALAAEDVPAAAVLADEAADRLAAFPPDAFSELRGLHLQVRAGIESARGMLPAALEHYAEAGRCFDAAGRISPVEHAELLQAHAEACIAAGRVPEASELLRSALRGLDATSAESLRVRLDERLHELDRSAWMLHASGRFVGHAEIERLLTEAGAAGFCGREEEVTILFSDLRSFTTLAEGLTPDVLVETLNRYLGDMTRCVEHYGGMVDKFIGDAVMAVFSLPAVHTDDADRAVGAALYMQAELERFNRTLPPGRRPFAAGIGLHRGTVVAGLIGSPQKRSYTVIGDAVNTASRLEGMTKQLGVPLLLTREVVDALVDPERWLLHPFGRYRPKGRKGAIEVFWALGRRDRGVEGAAAARRVEEATTAWDHFEAGAYDEAWSLYAALRKAAGSGPGERGYALLAAEAARRRQAHGTIHDAAIVLTEK